MENPENINEIATELIFGKYKTLEDAAKGYVSATGKIQEQGAEINRLKEQVIVPVEDDFFSDASWGESVKDWKKSNDIPDNVNLDKSNFLVQNLISGAKKAKLSRAQVKDFFTSTVKAQVEAAEKALASRDQEWGVDGVNKKKRLEQFSDSVLKGGDKEVLDSMISNPYITKKEVDFLERYILGDVENKEYQISPKKAEPVEVDIEKYRDESFEMYGKLMHSRNARDLEKMHKRILKLAELERSQGEN